MPGTEKLNDTYLYEKAPKEQLEKEYADVVESLKKSQEKVEKPQGIKKVLAEFLAFHYQTQKKQKQLNNKIENYNG